MLDPLHQPLPDRRAYSDRAVVLCAQLSDLAYREFKKKEEGEGLEEKEDLKKALDALGAELIGEVSKESEPLSLLVGKKLIDTQAMCGTQSQQCQDHCVPRH